MLISKLKIPEIVQDGAPSYIFIGNFMLDIAKHKKLLTRILQDIYTDATVGPYLGFKAGAAAHLLYNLNRFTLDLDFDFLDL